MTNTRLRWLLTLCAVPWAGGAVSCSCDDPKAGVDDGTGGQTDTDGDTGTASDTGTTGSVDTATGADDSTGQESGTETGSAEPARARLIYRDRDPNDIQRLYWVDYEDGPVGAPQTVHAALGADDTVNSFGATSPDRRWTAFTVFRAQAQSHELYVLDVTDPAFPDPVRVNVPPAPDPGIVLVPTFSPDSMRLAFTSVTDTSSTERNLFVVELDDDELAPVQINPALAPNGFVDSEVVFSPDGQRIAYVADMTGSGTTELYIQNADVADPGDPVQVSDGGAESPWWSPDGNVLYYDFDDDDDEIDEIHAVDVSGPPSAPQVHDPGDVGIVRTTRVAADGRGLTYWIGDDQSLYGDIVLVPTPGASFGTAVTLNQSPGQGFVADSMWSPDSTMLFFESTDDGSHDGWLVELAGTTPGPAMKVNEPLGAEAEVAGAQFAPDSAAVYYFVADAVGIALLRAEIDDGSIGPSTQLSLDDTYPSEELIFSEDGTQALFTAATDGNQQNLYWLDLSGGEPAAAVQLDPTEDPPVDVSFGSRFSPEGSAVFYTADGGFETPRLLYAVSTDAPGEAIFVAGQHFVIGARAFELP